MKILSNFKYLYLIISPSNYQTHPQVTTIHISHEKSIIQYDCEDLDGCIFAYTYIKSKNPNNIF